MSLDMERLLDAIRHVESGGNAGAVSPKGAKGPYQFMDATAAQYGVSDPFNEEQSRAGARRYMNDLLEMFNGDLDSAIVAYNGGPGRLQKRGSIAAMPMESRAYLVKVKAQYMAGTAVADATLQAQQHAATPQPVPSVESLFPGQEGLKRRALGALFPLNRENDALRASVLQAKPVNEAQRIYEMQLRTGLPVGVIERNLDAIEERARREDFDAEAFRKESPLLAEWLAKNPVRASIAQDDYETLSALEKTWQMFKAVPAGVEQGYKKERLMTLNYRAVTGEITPKEQIERDKLKVELQALGEQFEEGAPSWTKAAADIVGLQIGGMKGRAAGMLNEIGLDVFTAAGKTRVLSSAIEHDYGLAVGEAYSDLEDATDANGDPIDPVVARYAALAVAIPNTALEYASLSKALKVIPGADTIVGKLSGQAVKQILARPTVTAALAEFSKRYAVAVGTETFTEGMQKFLNIVAREIGTGDLGAGVTGEDFQAIAAESMQAFKGSATLGVLGTGPKVIELYANMKKAEHNEQFMRNLGEAAALSETNKRSPKAFGEYIQHLKENGPVKDVFIPIEQWDALFQDKAPEAAKEVFGDLKQYAEAQATGGDLVIPLETYAEKLAGTPFHEKLIENSRLNPGEMTPAEAAEAAKFAPEIQQAVERELADKMAEEAPLSLVYDDVYRKLKEVGVGTREADRNATLWREHIRSMSELTGIAPDELYNRKPLMVQRELPTGQFLTQGERGASVPSRNLIALGKAADPSTFVHESAHLWMEELRGFALAPDASDQLKQHWQTIKEWSGAGDDAISTEAHETFARGFEAYVMEGKAPSFQLREVFSQLMNWMMRIYQSMNMLDVKLTDEVRNVFDHLLATDDAIKLNRGRNEYDSTMFDESMMTEQEFNAYRQMIDEAKRTAEDTFRAKVMKELRREKTEAWRAEKKALYPVVRAEILEQPIYRAAYWLWSGKLPDGTQIPDMAATKLDKQSLLDMGVTLSDLPFRYQENGLHPDIVAKLFGFPSGESLVRELVGLPPLKGAIEEEVSRRIREKHGGIIVEGTTMEEAAMEVQNTRQIDVFNMELRILKRLGARREVSHPAIVKDIARQIVARKKIGELNPKLFEEAAFRAGQDAQDAMLGREFRSGTGRNLDAAFDAKARQMLNIYLFREAAEQRKQAEKSIKKWKKFLFRSNTRLAKSYNMDMVNAARAIASVHGIGSANQTAGTYMLAIREYDPQTYKNLEGIVSMASSDGRKVEDLTVDEFGVVRDAIEGLWALARRSKEVEIDGKRENKQTVVNILKHRAGELIKPGHKRAGYNQAVTKWEKTRFGLLGAKAMLRRVEHWVDAMDNGDPKGAFRKYIWQPVSESADRYREGRRVVLEKYMAIARRFPKESTKIGEIDATEYFPYVFSSKAELLGMLMHTGNESSKQKLLLGRGWGTLNELEELDSTRFDRFIKKMQDTGVLTKADYEFVQDVWDLFEELKPAAWQVHKKLYGFYPSELTASPITTPFGVFRGGYYPAKVDPFMVEDAAIRQEIEELEGQLSSFSFPSTGTGFMKQRSAKYNKPLSFDLGIIPQQLESVLRFTNLQTAVTDVGRIVTDKEFRETLAQLDPQVGRVMLSPWLQRSASQIIELPAAPGLQGVAKVFRHIRSGTAMQYVGLSVSVAAQQITGLSLAATKVKLRYLGGALVRYAMHPQAYRAQMNEVSTFMRNRDTTQLVDVRRAIDNIMLDPSKLKKARDFANEHAYFMTVVMQNVVDTITWGGAYEQAIQTGMEEKEAVRVANSAVRETQGSFAPEDISKFEAGSAHMRMFTMLYSFFNMAANLNATEFVKAMRLGGMNAGGRALYIYAFGFMIPSILADAISQAIGGQLFDDDDDDGYLDNLMSSIFGGQFRMATAMVPVVGPVVQAGVNQLNDKWYDDRITLSPAVSALEAAGRAALKHPVDIATEDDVRLNRPIKDLFTLIGVATGLPLLQAAKPIGYLTDLEQGEIEPPGNPAEAVRGLVSGRGSE